jgi:hypothetical protein
LIYNKLLLFFREGVGFSMDCRGFARLLSQFQAAGEAERAASHSSGEPRAIAARAHEGNYS